MTRLYDLRRWHRVRKRKLMRDPICEGCNERPSRHVDHIVPLDKGGGAYDPSNLQALCIPCHNKKTGCDKAGKQWLKPINRGCNADGSPRAASQEKNVLLLDSSSDKGMGDQSLHARAQPPAAAK
jgi:5-methylcytosine-specific restriction protein A